MVTSDPLRPLALLYLLWFICFSFQTQHSSLFHLLTSSSHFSSPENPGASEVVKLSNRRHELTVGHDLSPAVCFANFAILDSFFTFSLSLFHFHCCICWDVVLWFFFFLLKFIFQDFVEYQNVWPCWVCSLCALSKSYFLLSISQYWERFENVRVFFFFFLGCSC